MLPLSAHMSSLLYCRPLQEMHRDVFVKRSQSHPRNQAVQASKTTAIRGGGTDPLPAAPASVAELAAGYTEAAAHIAVELPNPVKARSSDGNNTDLEDGSEHFLERQDDAAQVSLDRTGWLQAH